MHSAPKPSDPKPSNSKPSVPKQNTQQVKQSLAEEERMPPGVYLVFFVLLVIATTLTVLAASYLIEFSEYEMYNTQGTVVNAWTKYDKDAEHSFVVIETVTYYKTEGDVAMQRNCTLRGKGYDTQRIADFVAHDVVPGQIRHMHASKIASDGTCMLYGDLVTDLGLGLLALVLPTLILGPFFIRAMLTVKGRMARFYQKWYASASSGSASGSQLSAELTTRSSGSKAYAALPTDSAHGGVLVAAQVVSDDRDESIPV
jgi:hypothetical protein